MYTTYFGLRFMPFNNSFASDLLYVSRAFNDAHWTVRAALDDGARAVFIGGVAGVGKTTLMRKLAAQSEHHERIISIPPTILDTQGVVDFCCESLNVNDDFNSTEEKTQALREEITSRQHNGVTTLLLLDVSEPYPRNLLDNIVDTFDLGARGNRAAQLVISARPEFETCLADNEFAEINGALDLRCTLQQLVRADVGPYISQHLAAANYHGDPLFDEETIDVVAGLSYGIPRRINNLCGVSLLSAYDKRLTQVTPDLVFEAVGSIGDLDVDTPLLPQEPEEPIKAARGYRPIPKHTQAAEHTVADKLADILQPESWWPSVKNWADRIDQFLRQNTSRQNALLGTSFACIIGVVWLVASIGPDEEKDSAQKLRQLRAQLAVARKERTEAETRALIAEKTAGQTAEEWRADAPLDQERIRRGIERLQAKLAADPTSTPIANKPVTDTTFEELGNLVTQTPPSESSDRLLTPISERALAHSTLSVSSNDPVLDDGDSRAVAPAGAEEVERVVALEPTGIDTPVELVEAEINESAAQAIHAPTEVAEIIVDDSAQAPDAIQPTVDQSYDPQITTLAQNTSADESNSTEDEPIPTADELLDPQLGLATAPEIIAEHLPSDGASEIALVEAISAEPQSPVTVEAAPMPKDDVYTVVAGDSLFAVGSRFSVSVRQLTAWNNLRSNQLKIGQSLKLTGPAIEEKPQARTDSSDTLFAAINAGDIAAVESLLRAGAPVDGRDASKNSPLMLVAGNNQVELVDLLLGHGANLNLQNDIGNTALAYAAWNGHARVAERLAANGARINGKNNEGRTALIDASINGHDACVRVLIDRSAKVNLRTRDQRTALSAAVWNGHVSTAKLLLNAGADVNASSRDGWTPLMDAAWNGNMDMVLLLLSSGADVGITTSAGLTALDTAMERGHRDVVTVLANNGNDSS